MEIKIEKQEKKSAQLPEKKFRAGPVSATIWKNFSSAKGEAVYFTISLERAYKDRDGKWQYASSLRVNDIPKAVLVLNKAYEFLLVKDNNPASAVAVAMPYSVAAEEIY